MRNIYLTSLSRAGALRVGRPSAFPWASQIPFVVGLLAALSLAWFA